MKKNLLFILAATLALGISSCQRGENAQPAETASLAAPQTAPEFALTDVSGRALALSTYRGRLVLLNFWATWCHPCREETPELISLQEKYREQGLQIIGISLDDDRAPVLEFVQRFQMNYPVAMGDVDLAERYGGILGLPVSLLIGCDGRIEKKYSGRLDMPLVEQDLQPLLKAQPCRTNAPAGTSSGR